jgi:hypothetical protein
VSAAASSSDEQAKEKEIFYYTLNVWRKRVFTIDNSANPMKSKQLALITALFWTWNHSATYREAKPERVILGRRDYRQEEFCASTLLSYHVQTALRRARP